MKQTKLVIDNKMLNEVIGLMVNDATGACVDEIICIGEIGHKQIHLTVTSVREDFISPGLWQCVKAAGNAPSAPRFVLISVATGQWRSGKNGFFPLPTFQT